MPTIHSKYMEICKPPSNNDETNKIVCLIFSDGSMHLTCTEPQSGSSQDLSLEASWH